MACGQIGNLDIEKSIHGYLICTRLISDLRLGTAMVNIYAKCNRVGCAQTIFKGELSDRSLVSWNSFNGYDQKATLLYERMMSESNLKPDIVTFANVVPPYASLANIRRIQSNHTFMVKKCLDMDEDIYSRNSNGTCIWEVSRYKGNNLNHHADKSMSLFLEMLQSKVFPIIITMVMLSQSCGEIRSLKQETMVHCCCLSKGSLLKKKFLLTLLY